MRPSSYWQRLFVEHDLGESSGSAADAARRTGYPWTGQMTRKMLRNVEKRGVQAARNGPSPPPTPAGGPVAKPELDTADRLGSRERAAGATHFAAPMSACTRSTFTRTEQAFGSKRKKPVPEGPAHADDGFTASRCGLSGTGS